MATVVNHNESTVIEIENLHKAFGGNKVLKGFNLTLQAGETLAVMGKSGSGKSVLIKCIIGLENIDRGKLMVLNHEVPQLNRKQLDELRTDIGFQFQGSALYDSMTVRENLEFPLRRHPDKLGTDYHPDKLVNEALDDVGLLHAIDMMPSELSGGMKKRIALARTLIMRPKIILYDEPTSGLDPITGKEISALINAIQERYHTAAIVITHDLACARMTSNRMIILHDGKNYAEATYHELAQVDDPNVKAFFT
ncbi:MAG: ATP-binding cassette domain-containing protein [Cyclobacteriaceae bacterium]|nr:ATP-binding cassette domain-containing protein [Cyclobacteriaceae bacterium]